MDLRRWIAWLPQGIAFRIGVLVFSAALFASLAISWVSVRSIESFLLERIDRQFPDLLHAADERFSLWYRQRELDLEVFARSPILVEGIGRGAKGREELTRYLSYLLEDLPQFDALVLRSGADVEPLWVGPERSLPPHVPDAGIGALRWVGDQRIQLVTTKIVDAPGATLSGILRLSDLDVAVSANDGDGVSVALLDASGTWVAGGRTTLPTGLVPEGLAEVTATTGQRLVASGKPAARFGWILVVEQPYDAAFAPVTLAVRRALAINLALAVLSSLTAFVFAAWRLRPIGALDAAARRFADGDAEVRVETRGGDDEIQRLGRSFNDMAERLSAGRGLLETRNRELEQANEVLAQLSITDGLTKLHNHRHFQDQYQQEAKRATRNRSPLALVLVDIDDFKRLNDELGHHAGDRVLEGVARAMNEQLRGTDYLARYGGEEFAILLPDTDAEGALVLAEKVRSATSRFETAVGPGGRPVSVTVSIGVASYAESTGATFERADRALYAAKDAGKDNVQLAPDPA